MATNEPQDIAPPPAESTPVTPVPPAPNDFEAEVSSIRARRRKKFNWNIVVMPLLFIAGIALGFFARPLVLPAQSASGKGDVIDLLVSQTRHFKGNANAPITMLEFSDFQ